MVPTPLTICPMSHYFAEHPEAASKEHAVTLSLPDYRADLAVDRGVFSAAGVDPGTVELLRAGAPGGRLAAQSGVTGHLLDLGCGYGPIALTLAHRFPEATVWGVDVNERALALCARNSAGAGLGDRVRAVTADEVPSDIRFAQIWSNPPIRIGKAALHDLLESWMSRLAEGGAARLVVHKHLGGDSLAAWLESLGYAVVRVGSRKGYRLLEVTR